MISVTITRKQLEVLDACKEGLKLFDKMAAEQGRTDSVYIEDWGPLAFVMLREACDGYLPWLLSRGALPAPNFAGQKLCSIKFNTLTLSGADFSIADLRGAIFTDSDIRYCKFHRAKMQGACLYSANLQCSGMDLVDADDSNASRANFSRTILALSSWRNCNLKNSIFDHSTIRRADFRGADLEGASFKHVQAYEAKFDIDSLSGEQIKDLKAGGWEPC